MNREPSNGKVTQRQFDPAECDPHVAVVTTVADLKDEDQDNLSPVYSKVGDVIADVFSDPPAQVAEMQITFTYEGYRITIHQGGNAEFVKI